MKLLEWRGYDTMMGFKSLLVKLIVLATLFNLGDAIFCFVCGGKGQSVCDDPQLEPIDCRFKAEGHYPCPSCDRCEAFVSYNPTKDTYTHYKRCANTCQESSSTLPCASATLSADTTNCVKCCAEDGCNKCATPNSAECSGYVPPSQAPRTTAKAKTQRSADDPEPARRDTDGTAPQPSHSLRLLSNWLLLSGALLMRFILCR